MLDEKVMVVFVDLEDQKVVEDPDLTTYCKIHDEEQGLEMWVMSLEKNELKKSILSEDKKNLQLRWFKFCECNNRSYK